MKINIRNAAPILHRNSNTPEGSYSFSVSGWEVQGTYLTDSSQVRVFDFNIGLASLETTEEALKNYVKNRIENER